MHARVTTFTGALDTLDAQLETVTEQVLPWVRGLTGYRGLVTLVDRDAGTMLAITFWETEEAMTASGQLGPGVRDLAAASVGARSEGVAAYEVVLFEPGP